ALNEYELQQLIDHLDLYLSDLDDYILMSEEEEFKLPAHLLIQMNTTLDWSYPTRSMILIRLMKNNLQTSGLNLLRIGSVIVNLNFHLHHQHQKWIAAG
ncbi:hypothetical protein JTB14_019328, partial [Gonioctena quinquepunctata]